VTPTSADALEKKVPNLEVLSWEKSTITGWWFGTFFPYIYIYIYIIYIIYIYIIYIYIIYIYIIYILYIYIYILYMYIYIYMGNNHPN